MQQGAATRLAGMIVALAGRRGWCEVTRARLGGTIGKSRRTITRRLADLIRLGYIAVRRTKTARGGDAGLRILVLPPLLAYFLVKKGGWPKMAGNANPFRNRRTEGRQAAGDFAHHASREPPDREKG